jgi:hypothetical protein
VELDAVLEGQPRSYKKAFVQLSIDTYPGVLGVHFFDNLVPLHSRLTNNEATKQLVGLQGLCPCKFTGSLQMFLDCLEFILPLILLSFCLAFLGSLEQRFYLLPDF